MTYEKLLDWAIRHREDTGHALKPEDNPRVPLSDSTIGFRCCECDAHQSVPWSVFFDHVRKYSSERRRRLRQERWTRLGFCGPGQ